VKEPWDLFKESTAKEQRRVDELQRLRSGPMLNHPACEFAHKIGVPKLNDLSAPTSEFDKKLSQASIQKFKMFILLADTSSDAYFVKDLSFKYVYVNSAMGRLLNLPRLQIVGAGDGDLFPEKEAGILRKACEEVCKGWTVRVKSQRHVQGVKRVFLDTLVPWRDEAGNVTAIYGTFVDITDLRDEFHYWQMEDTQYPSSAMRSTLEQALLVSRAGSTVLLTGESGGGKDFLSQYIHDHSDRSHGPFKSINCAAIPSGLVESELFGHEKGAFAEAHQMKQGLIELAQGGTVLLNEIGELPLPLQSKLLTFLDTRSFTRLGGVREIKVDARLIAATNRNLVAEIKKGNFRSDLFYRLNVFSIRVPSLRDRLEDIHVLVKNLGPVIAKTVGVRPLPKIRTSALDRLMQHNWPGNVRELRNVMERAVIFSQGAPIDSEIVERALQSDQMEPTESPSLQSIRPRGNPKPIKEIPKKAKRPSPTELHSLYQEYIAEKNWTRDRLSEHLGVDSSTLKKWFKEANLPAGKAGRPKKKPDA
jgi:PAS domain S-box-containing protein